MHISIDEVNVDIGEMGKPREMLSHSLSAEMSLFRVSCLGSINVVFISTFSANINWNYY
jgi:hypothetical protein